MQINRFVENYIEYKFSTTLNAKMAPWRYDLEEGDCSGTLGHYEECRVDFIPLTQRRHTVSNFTPIVWKFMRLFDKVCCS